MSMFYRYFCILIFSALLIPTASIAQNMGTLNGSLVDAKTNEPLPGAHVYLAHTTIGSVTSPSGEFVLQDVQPGAYQLIVSIIGYKSYREPVYIKADESTDLTVKLDTDVYQIGEITVTGKKPQYWKRDLGRFKRMFLGITKYRSGCDIENPLTISFDKKEKNVFDASAQEPIVVISKSTGYKITYHLEMFEVTGDSFRFTGYPVFEELTPKNEKEEKKWKKNREKLYSGSFQHFLRSLAAGTSKEEGFSLYLTPNLHWEKPHQKFKDLMLQKGAKVSPSFITYDHGVSYERSLQFYGFLHIIYDHEVMDRDFYEWIALDYSASKERVRAAIQLSDNKAKFNELGFLNDPFSVVRLGYWNWESGLCNWLPFNYGL